MEWYNSARHLQTRPLHPQTHPLQLFDVLERICGTAPNMDLGLCDEARECCLSCHFLFTFFSVALGFRAMNRSLYRELPRTHTILKLTETFCWRGLDSRIDREVSGRVGTYSSMCE